MTNCEKCGKEIYWKAEFEKKENLIICDDCIQKMRPDFLRPIDSRHPCYFYVDSKCYFYALLDSPTAEKCTDCYKLLEAQKRERGIE
jgi:DNA-directed RNA polymerase subunit RPC12/RpoP